MLRGVSMAPPSVGSEVPVTRVGRVTRHNDDETVNIKFDRRPGAPRKVHLKYINLGPPPLPPKTIVELVACKGEEQRTPIIEDLGIRRSRSTANVIGWGSFLTVAGAIGVGVFHGIGNRILDAIWPYLEAVLRNAS
jgi:hypothetical protein